MSDPIYFTWTITDTGNPFDRWYQPVTIRPVNYDGNGLPSAAIQIISNDNNWRQAV